LSALCLPPVDRAARGILAHPLTGLSRCREGASQSFLGSGVPRKCVPFGLHRASVI
jgi:hypothetical protein